MNRPLFTVSMILLAASALAAQSACSKNEPQGVLAHEDEVPVEVHREKFNKHPAAAQ